MVWNINFMTFHILGIIIPTDFHVFQRGRYTTNQNSFGVHTGGRRCFGHRQPTLTTSPMVSVNESAAAAAWLMDRWVDG